MASHGKMAPMETLAQRLELAEAPKRPSRTANECDADQGRALLAAHYTQVLLDAARDMGVDRSGLFGDEPVFATRGRSGLWSHKDLGIVSDNLRRATGDELWGLAPDARIPLGTFKFAGELFLASDNLGEALNRAFRLYDLFDAVKFGLQVDGDRAAMTISTPPMPQAHAAFVAEWHLWHWRYVAQWFVRSEIRMLRIDFPHAPRVDPNLYDGTFGSRCRFNADEARLVFHRNHLRRPIDRTARELDDFLLETSVTLRFSPQVEHTVSTDLRIALLAHLQSQKSIPTLEDLAVEKGVSDQTLRRRLAAEGVSYRTLKAEVRSVVARHYLARPGATLSELASRAGFSDTTAFTRAFRSWTGMSVSQFRRIHGSRAAAEEARPAAGAETGA